MLKNLQLVAAEESTLHSMNKDLVWNPAEMMVDPLGDGRDSYSFENAVELLLDMEEYSHFSEPFDSLDILSGQPNQGMTVNSQVINLIVSQSLQDEIFQNIGDKFTYCISSPSPKRLGDLKYRQDVCQVKFKVRALASFNKIAGFPKFSGYKQMNNLGPGMMATQNQVAAILDRVTDSFDEMRETRQQHLIEYPMANLGLSKEALFIKLAPGTSRQDRLRVSNTVLAAIDDPHAIMFDSIGYNEDLDERLKFIQFFGYATSAICLVLGSFQLIMTLSANIRDSMWELGVLRSIGWNQMQITKVMVYELMVSTLAAMLLGFVSGVVVSILAVATFHIIVELPLQVELPLSTMGVVFVFSLMSLVAGGRYGASTLFKRNIASILKGD